MVRLVSVVKAAACLEKIPNQPNQPSHKTATKRNRGGKDIRTNKMISLDELIFSASCRIDYPWWDDGYIPSYSDLINAALLNFLRSVDPNEGDLARFEADLGKKAERVRRLADWAAQVRAARADQPHGAG